MYCKRLIWLVALALCVSASAQATGTSKQPTAPAAKAASHPPVQYITYEQARTLLREFADELPAELRDETPAMLESAWPEYVKRRDRETRARLAQGEEDSLVNLLLFGTSFTHQPRITNEFMATSENVTGDAAANDTVTRTYMARVDDFIATMNAANRNERVAYMRRLLEQKGYRADTPANKAKLRDYLKASLDRVRDEFGKYRQTLQTARASGDLSDEFAARSTLFQTRGVSLDTSLMPNFALERALSQMLAKKLLAPNSVRRVAIIGPGLDFVDKQEGYDF